MSNILYVIDGYLSSKDKAEVTLELIQQLRKLDGSRKIMLINKFGNSWGIDTQVDFYREYLDGFMVGYPPEEIINSNLYNKPYVYYEVNSGILENWMPFVGVSDHVANVYNGFIYGIQEANKEDTKQKRISEKNQIMRFFRSATPDLILMLDFMNEIIDAKLMIVRKLETIKSIGTFIRTDDGFKVTAPEGFVAVDRLRGSAVKLIDRLEFSQANFNAAKNWSK